MKPDPKLWYLADSTLHLPNGKRVEFGEGRPGSDGAVISTFEAWMPSPATLDELRSHAAARHQQALDAAVAARATRTGNEHLTAKERGEE
jgi:hypothetical protein